MTGFLTRAEAAELATGRRSPLFSVDLELSDPILRDRLNGRRVLVIGGAGSIGSATTGELSRFDLAALHVVDLNENGLTELVRDLRSRREGLAIADFRTLPIDFGAPVMERLLGQESPYDIVLNFAALKHVRSEKDGYSLLQMYETNVVKARRLLNWLGSRGGTGRYFSVSTDKAANPVNLMGASKRLMEHVIFSNLGPAKTMEITSARFANVAFSAGSLLEGWLLRLEKRQPVAVPRATRRYFLSLQESGQLCLLAAVAAPDRTIVIPRLEEQRHLVDLEDIARAVLGKAGYRPMDYTDEAEARAAVADDMTKGGYPLLLTSLDTSGEKAYEEFVGVGETSHEIGLPNLLGIHYSGGNQEALQQLTGWLERTIGATGEGLSKRDFVAALALVIPELRHIETDKQLDDRM